MLWNEYCARQKQHFFFSFRHSPFVCAVPEFNDSFAFQALLHIHTKRVVVGVYHVHVPIAEFVAGYDSEPTRFITLRPVENGTPTSRHKSVDIISYET